MVKSIIARLRIGGPAPSFTEVHPLGDVCPSVGNIYAFQTTPLSEFAAPETNRYAAFKIIGVNDTHFAIAVLDGVWDHPPRQTEVSKARVLRQHRFAHTGRTAAFGVQIAWWTPGDLKGVVLIGRVQLTAEESGLGGDIISFAAGTSHATLNAANHSAEGEWRWANDREALIAEQEKIRARDATIRAAEEHRYRTRLIKLTWDQLLSETPFERWSPSPPFPPANFTQSARQKIHETCRDLSALGPKPKKAQVRAILKGCVEWFNRADDEAGGVIETEEREDICAVLEELAFIARQKALFEEIDAWREW